MINTFERTTRQWLPAACAALAIAAVPVGVQTYTDAQPPPRIVGAPCTNGVIPGNPYIVNCNLPARRAPVIGAAPDAGAIIACRNVPGCLSYFVNSPGQLSPAAPNFGN